MKNSLVIVALGASLTALVIVLKRESAIRQWRKDDNEKEFAILDHLETIYDHLDKWDQALNRMLEQKQLKRSQLVTSLKPGKPGSKSDA